VGRLLFDVGHDEGVSPEFRIACENARPPAADVEVDSLGDEPDAVPPAGILPTVSPFTETSNVLR
jgi:hypothetical protein